MNTEHKELEEGEEYQFKVIKHVEQTHSSPFWILEDPFGKRHVLRSKHYEGYEIKPEAFVKMRVTYISCTGKVTLEPEHPYYKVGTVHPFKFIKHDYRLGSEGQKQQVLIIADKYGQEAVVYPNNNQQISENFQPETLHCKIKGLKNGALDLELIDNT